MPAKDSNWVLEKVVDWLPSQEGASRVSDVGGRDVRPCSAARLDRSVPHSARVRARAAALPASVSGCQFPVKADS